MSACPLSPRNLAFSVPSLDQENFKVMASGPGWLLAVGSRSQTGTIGLAGTEGARSGTSPPGPWVLQEEGCQKGNRS